MTHEYDVVIATDCRLPGGTSASTAEEIVAQSRAGLRTGVVHVDSPLVSRTRPLNPRVRSCLARGEADLIMPGMPVTTSLLVIRHPKVALGVNAPHVPRIEAGRCLILINQEPVTGPNVHYRASEVDASVRQWTGLEPIWMPIGPLVRQSFAEAEPDQPMFEDDWVNIIDVDAWSVARGPISRRPIRIGRHSRDHPLKWPASADEIRQAYPTTDDIEVHVLGGATHALTRLGGRRPANWIIHPFGSVDVLEFLRELDVFVYLHHPDLTEAFGRTILEAMASGLPVITDRRFEMLFGSAAIYASPSEVTTIVRRLAADPEFAESHRRAGVDFARRWFGYERHIERVANLSGLSVDTSLALRKAPTPVPPSPVRSRRVLFISPNGAGMGHLARVMAVARRLDVDARARFFTFSSAAGIVEKEGFDVEYFPSRTVTASKSAPWHRVLAERLDDVMQEFRPDVVVIDGTEPYRGVLRALARHPEVAAVWLRRGMWKEGVSNAVFREGSSFFDLVLEPGDLAFGKDRGVTAQRDDVARVPPVTYLSHHEMLDRATARSELGVAAGEEAVLINLGAGNINETGSMLRRLVELLASDRRRLFVVKSPIGESQAVLDAVTVLDVYPLARLMPGFDLAVSASGYNSFHELLLARVPTVFVPNESTLADDQVARARWASDDGCAVCAASEHPDDVAIAMERLLDEEVRRSVIERLTLLEWQNGATEIAAAIDLPRVDSAGEERRRSARSDAVGVIEALAIGGVDQPRNATRSDARTPSLGQRAVGRGVALARRRVSDEQLRRIANALPRPLAWRIRRLLGIGIATTATDRKRRRAATASKPQLRVPPGRVLGTVDERRLATALVVIEPEIDNRSVVAAVARRQMVERTFAPVFLTQSLEASAFRDNGYVWEHLRQREGDETDAAWSTRRQRLFQRVVAAYAPTIIVSVSRLADIEDDTSLFAQSVRTLDPTT